MTPTQKLVPVEPDAEIIEAMFDAFKAVPRRGAGGQSIEADWAHKYAPMVAAYRTMIAAATEAPPEPTSEYLAYNEPLTSTAEAEIISGIMLVKKSDVPTLWRRRHPDNIYTDQQAIDEFTVVNWAWDWPQPPEPTPASLTPDERERVVKRMNNIAKKCRDHAENLNPGGGWPGDAFVEVATSIDALLADLTKEAK